MRKQRHHPPPALVPEVICSDRLLGKRPFVVLGPDGYLLRFFQDLGEREVAS